LCHRGHGENAVYRKAFPRQVGLQFICNVPGNCPLEHIEGQSRIRHPVKQREQRRGCYRILTAVGC
jgi:hypothetical protein